MSILFVDFETYYDNEYSLKNLTPPEYILDPRYETIGMAACLDGAAGSHFVDGPEVPAYLAGLDPAATTVVAFNAMFDCAILGWRYNFVPARLVCTMRLAVALRGHELPNFSLAKVGSHLGVGDKGTILHNYQGKRRADFIGNYLLWEAYKNYATNDNDMNRAIFLKLMPEFPVSERRVMDLVLRCGIVPKFVIDKPMLQQHLRDIRELQAELLIEAGANTTMDAPDRTLKLEDFAKTMRSSGKFEQILKERGIEIEYKPSTTDPERRIPALAKTDPFMASLQTHEDPEIQALAAARLGCRSTIEETRGKRILDIANLNWPGYLDGNLPVPLKYAAAHTHRLGGDWKINLQNLPSGRGGKLSKLRKALCAPAGHKVVVADKSQIEARINAYICGQESLLQQFRNKEDPYALMAASIFSQPINKTDHPVERFIGKTAVLGCGYGCGHERFYAMVIAIARTLGMDMPKLKAMFNINTAQHAVGVYRSVNGRIAMGWHKLDEILRSTWTKGVPAVTQFGPVLIGKGYVEGPGGLTMRYANPRFDTESATFLYDYAGRTHKMYGAKFLENIVQFLARINVMHDALRIADRGYPFQLQSHDELAWIVPDAKVEHCMAVALKEMRRPPAWAEDIPLDAEASFGQSYGAAK